MSKKKQKFSVRKKDTNNSGVKKYHIMDIDRLGVGPIATLSNRTYANVCCAVLNENEKQEKRKTKE